VAKSPRSFELDELVRKVEILKDLKSGTVPDDALLLLWASFESRRSNRAVREHAQDEAQAAHD
jgi:hypothetical protein